MQGKCLRLTLMIVLALLLDLGRSAVAAQGYRPGLSTALPGPVSSLDLAGYGAMMSLTAEQIRAWGEVHERYKSDFKTVGESGGAIAAFIEARKAAEGVPFGAQPPRSVIERWMNAHQSAFSAMAALDARLFDELAPLLTEDQQPLWQRAKLSRERSRLAGDEIVYEWLDSRTQADLCAIFASFQADADLSLTDDQRIGVWAALDAYQAQWVGQLRSVQDDARSLYRAWSKLLEERGVPVNAVDLRQRDTMDREMFQRVSAAWREVTERVKPRLTEMAKNNRAKAKSIASLLPPGDADRFMQAFVKTAYAGAPLMDLDSHAGTLRRALEMKDLTDDERAALQAQVDDCRRTAGNIAEQSADAIDMLQQDQRPNSSWQSPEAQQALRDAYEAAQREGSRLTQALYALISVDRLKAHLSIDKDERWREMFRKGGVSDPEEIEELLVQLHATGSVRIGQRGGAESVIPDALSKADVKVIVTTLALDEDASGILRQLHSDYARQYRQRFDAHADVLNAFALAGWSMRDDGHGGKKMGMAPPEDVEKAMALDAGAIAALRQLDAAFFEDAQAAIAPNADALWRARLARDWTTLARGSRRGSEELRTYEASVPLLVLVAGLALSEEETATANAIFRDRADEFRAVATSQFETNRAAWYARQLASGLAEGPMPAAKDVVDAQEQKATALEKSANEKRLALAAVIRSILDELVAALPAHAQTLQDGFERAAFPHVFEDRTSPGEALAKALALDDLTDPQRTEIEAAAAKYRPAYRDVCARMIEVNREWDRDWPYSRVRIPEQDEAKLKWDRLVFERDELNAGVAAMLQRVLSVEQRAAVGLETAK